MPNPLNYDDKDKFINDCISCRHKEGKDKSNDQSIAVCMSMWRNRHKKSETAIDLKRKLLATLLGKLGLKE